MFTITTGDIIGWIALLVLAIVTFTAWYRFDKSRTKEKRLKDELTNDLRRIYERQIFGK